MFQQVVSLSDRVSSVDMKLSSVDTKLDKLLALLCAGGPGGPPPAPAPGAAAAAAAADVEAQGQGGEKDGATAAPRWGLRPEIFVRVGSSSSRTSQEVSSAVRARAPARPRERALARVLLSPPCAPYPGACSP
jgi:hypothetical protein